MSEAGIEEGRGRCGDGLSSPAWWVRSPPIKMKVSWSDEFVDEVVRASPAR